MLVKIHTTIVNSSHSMSGFAFMSSCDLVKQTEEIKRGLSTPIRNADGTTTDDEPTAGQRLKAAVQRKLAARSRTRVSC